MDNANFRQWLDQHTACADAQVWVGTRSSEQAWAECARADWMMWEYAEAGAEICARYHDQIVTLARSFAARAAKTAARCAALLSASETARGAGAAAYCAGEAAHCAGAAARRAGAAALDAAASSARWASSAAAASARWASSAAREEARWALSTAAEARWAASMSVWSSSELAKADAAEMAASAEMADEVRAVLPCPILSGKEAANGQ